MNAIYDASAHEPLTETPWDPERAEEGVAAIVADAEASLADCAWPNHPLDEDERKATSPRGDDHLSRSGRNDLGSPPAWLDP